MLHHTRCWIFCIKARQGLPDEIRMDRLFNKTWQSYHEGLDAPGCMTDTQEEVRQPYSEGLDAPHSTPDAQEEAGVPYGRYARTPRRTLERSGGSHTARGLTLQLHDRPTRGSEAVVQ
jgi:hypothetical protein